MRIGAQIVDGEDKGCKFTVWAPLLAQVSVEVVQVPASPVHSFSESSAEGPGKQLPMTQDERGYWHSELTALPAGTQYRYRIKSADSDEVESWPDPASRFQPEGVHGPSEVVDQAAFGWADKDWQGVKLANYLIYELHVGTFTPEGTFESAITRLPDLVELGITAVEIMPVAQFPGHRNWGYDGAYPFAVQNSYGGPEGLKAFVDACHQQGMAVVLDVVYNHFGPEGNYTGKFGPYTTDRYRTPWGNAINFDDAYAHGVRQYFIENAISWLRDYHIDALRLDAVHAIYDFSAKHFLQALAEAVYQFAKDRAYPAYLIAESDLNDPRLIRPVEKGGYQLDAQWSDDFHHALHTRLTGEVIGYYSDFASLEMLADAIKNRFVYAGQYSPFRRREHGSSALDIASDKFVVCSQNHDQIGNRMTGDRFSTLLSFDAQKLAAGITLLSPYIPLLFMGEEYGENAPFLYFVDHGDPDLIKSVQTGRKEEFRAFHSEGTPPDPASADTFKASKLQWPRRSTDQTHKSTVATQGNSSTQQQLLNLYYKQLIKVRKQCQIMTTSQHPEIETHHTDDILYYHRLMKSGDLLCVVNFGKAVREVELPLGKQIWHRMIYSADPHWSVSKDAAASFTPKTLTNEATPSFSLASRSIALYRAEV